MFTVSNRGVTLNAHKYADISYFTGECDMSPKKFREFAAEVSDTLANVNGREKMTVSADNVREGDLIGGLEVSENYFAITHRRDREVVLGFKRQGGYLTFAIDETIQIERPIS